MSALDAPGTIHGLRVLLTGVYDQISGRQPSTRLTAGGEVFQTERYLKRLLARRGLRVSRTMLDSSPQTPSWIIVKDTGRS